MSGSADTVLVKDNMKATFGHRQEMVHNPEMSSVVIDLFPRFMDTPGLVRRRKDGDLGDGGLCFLESSLVHVFFLVWFMFFLVWFMKLPVSGPILARPQKGI